MGLERILVGASGSGSRSHNRRSNREERRVTKVEQAEIITDKVLQNILGRKGFDNAWDEIDADIQKEIKADLLQTVWAQLTDEATDPDVNEHVARAIEMTKMMRNSIGHSPEGRSLSLAITNLEQAGLWLCEYGAQTHQGADALLDWLRGI